MPNYYVDISADNGIGNMNGSDPNNYMGWNQMMTYNSNFWTPMVQGTFLLRGSRDISPAQGIWALLGQFKAWDKAAYGPWRMYGAWSDINQGFQINSQSNAFAFGMEDGIFETTNNLYLDLNGPNIALLKNMVLIVRGSAVTSQIELYTINANCVVTFEGCRLSTNTSFSNGGVYFGRSNGLLTVNLIDTIIEGPVHDQGGVAINSSRCAIAPAGGPTDGTNTNCQLDWTNTSPLPDWTAAQSLWMDSSLSIGINTPPEPGTVPYTGYNKGLWGEYRHGIGAAYFGPSVRVIDVLPINASLGTVVMDSTTDTTFTVTNSGTSSLTVSSITGVVPPLIMWSDLVTGPPIPSLGSAKFVVRYIPDTTANLNATINIISNDSSANPFNVYMDATPVPVHYDVYLYPDQFNFGATVIDETNTVSFSIYNGSNVALNIGALSGLSAPFYLTGDTISNTSLPPFTSSLGNAYLNFIPDITGTFYSQLVIPSNNPTQLYVDLTGTGSVPSDYYVYLNDSYTSLGHAGSQIDPWSFEDFFNYADMGLPLGGDVINLKGQRTISHLDIDSYSSPGLVTLQGWDSEINGPWRLNCTDEISLGDFDNVFSVAIQDCIIQTNSLYISSNEAEPAYIKNSYIYAMDTFEIDFYDNGQIDIEGSTIVAVNQFYFYNDDGYNSSYNFKDSNIINGGETGVSYDGVNNSALNLTNCTMYLFEGDFDTFGSNFNSVTKTNCQFGLGFMMPAWDADQNSFSYDFFSSLFTTPPKPGNPPYSGYEAGLWGEDRLGIGAFYFGGFVPPKPTIPPTSFRGTGAREFFNNSIQDYNM